MAEPTWATLTPLKIAPELPVRAIPFALDNSEIVSILEGNPFELFPGMTGMALLPLGLVITSAIAELYEVDSNPITSVDLNVVIGAAGERLISSFPSPDLDTGVCFPVVGGTFQPAANLIGQGLYLVADTSGTTVTGGDAGNTITGTLAVAVLSV